MTDHYAILGISRTATDAEIKTAFKKLAILYHPDKNAGDPKMEERFKEVNHAYQILSNPYEKVRYDLRSNYGRKTPQEGRSSQPHTYTYQQRSHTYKSPYNYKENWIATAYAFGFTLIMATLVMGGIHIKQYLDTHRLNALLATRRSEFALAKEKYRTGKLDSALSLINSLGGFMPSEKDIAEYKAQMYESLIYQAQHDFYSGSYQEAIYHMELIDKFSPKNPLPIQEHLADAYLKTHQPKKAIKKIKELLIQEYRKMELYTKLARIHHHELSNAKEALRYYEIASDLAIKRYKFVYGEGYPFVLSGKTLSPEHYQLYTGLALACLQTGNPQRAVKATQWNIRMWPDSVSNYIIAANGHFRLSNIEKACENKKLAQGMGYQGSFEFECYE